MSMNFGNRSCSLVLSRKGFPKSGTISTRLFYHLYKSLLIWRFEHIVQLQPRSCQFLLLRTVRSMQRSFFSCHINKNHHPHQSHKEHAARHWSDDKSYKVLAGYRICTGRDVKNQLDKPLLWRNLQHVV